MRLKIDSCKVHDSSIYLKIMDYVDEVIKKHSISGNFNFVTLCDYEIAKRYGFTRIDSNGLVTMTNDFYECVKGLIELGILVKTDDCITFRKTTKYCISKQEFLILYCVLLTVSSFSQEKIKRLNKLNFGNKVKEIVENIRYWAKNSKTFFDKPFNNVIKQTYYYLYKLCEDAVKRNKEFKAKLNPYVIFYKSIYNIKPLSHYLLFYSNKIHTDIVSFFNVSSFSWFTEKYLEEKRNDSKDMEEYYENVLSKNKYLQPIIEKLNNEFDRLTLHDFKIDADLFSRIPGNTYEKKKEILNDIVKYWMIKNCPFLNYSLGLVDKIKTLEDKYRMNIHIKLTETSNQYGISGYTIHFSGRMTNDFCRYHKAEHCPYYYQSREYALEKMGFDKELDLHSSIFSIAKSINKHTQLDLSFDIKKDLEELKIVGTINKVRRLLKDKDYKGLVFYMFFSDGCHDAYNSYKNRYNAKFHKLLNQYEEYFYDEVIDEVVEQYKIEKEKIDKRVAKVNESKFIKIHSCIEQKVGKTTSYMNNIFVIESSIMALTIYSLSQKGYSVKNVYDCIWWKSSEISEEEVSKTFVESAKEVFNIYYSIANEQNNSL